MSTIYKRSAPPRETVKRRQSTFPDYKKPGFKERKSIVDNDEHLTDFLEYLEKKRLRVVKALKQGHEKELVMRRHKQYRKNRFVSSRSRRADMDCDDEGAGYD